MKNLIYSSAIIIIATNALLLVFCPDALSMGIVGVMLVCSVLSVWFGLIPTIRFSNAFAKGQTVLEKEKTKNGKAWNAVSANSDIFGNKQLNNLFADYLTKSRQQKESGQIMSDPEDFINEDTLSMMTWRPITSQMPGIMTGLGILGTFIGLVLGVRNIGFNTMEATLASIEQLLGGIDVAFYTSIAGVISSIILNIANRVTWSLCIREYGMFISIFHRYIMPDAEEQGRLRERSEYDKSRELLTLIRKDIRDFVNGTGLEGSSSAATVRNEKTLIPQVESALQNGEFQLEFIPRFNLVTGDVIAAETSLVWIKPNVGKIPKNDYMPTLENDGYAARMARTEWSQAAEVIRRWEEDGKRPLILSVHVYKSEFLAMDIVKELQDICKEKGISQGNIEVSMDASIFESAEALATETKKNLQRAGFRTAVTKLNGNFSMTKDTAELIADSWQVDARDIDRLDLLVKTARTHRVTVSAYCIENTQIQTDLIQKGIKEGCGNFLHKAVSLQELEADIFK